MSMDVNLYLIETRISWNAWMVNLWRKASWNGGFHAWIWNMRDESWNADDVWMFWPWLIVLEWAKNFDISRNEDAGFPSTIQMFDCEVGFGLIQDGGFPRLPRLPGMDDLTHHGLDVQKLLGETMAKRSATSVPFRDSQTSSRPRLWPLWWASTCAQDCRTAMSFWERMGKDGENVRYLGRFCPCLWLYGVFGLPFWQTNFQAGRFCLSRFG